MSLRIKWNIFKILQKPISSRFSAPLLWLPFIIIVCILTLELLPLQSRDQVYHKFSLYSSDHSESVLVSKSPTKLTSTRQENCSFHSCIDVHHCGWNDEERISIYIYPYRKYIDDKGYSLLRPISKEFQEIMQTIAESDYYTSNPKKACMFVPSIDLLNQETMDTNLTSHILSSIPFWNGGKNHILFNMIPGVAPHFNSYLEVDTGQAIMAGSSLSMLTHRKTFDVSIPEFNPLLASSVKKPANIHISRRYLLMSTQIGLHREYRDDLNKILSNNRPFVLIVNECSLTNYTPLKRCDSKNMYSYPDILQESDFCFVIRGNRLGQSSLGDVMAMGCIPVVVSDDYVLPFDSVLDWSTAAVRVREDDLSQVMSILRHYSRSRISNMRRQVLFYWTHYFGTIRAITTTTLKILNDRFFPHRSRSSREWNLPPNEFGTFSPLFVPLIPSRSLGFTAVILTFDRIDSLIKVILQVAQAPSLNKVIVVWNNQRKSPPHVSVWPKISKPIKVIQTKRNLLSNRFFPYSEIETDCVLSLDDDIIMLTADELEFGYQVWLENFDRIVGFPSRLHTWDNLTHSWRYQSEWGNDISMVLTGAAFYHKYFGYLYMISSPSWLLKWVDREFNCEDILMNFIVTNATGKAPIKVTPRKKFTCPACTSTDTLSTDYKHMAERSQCINKFATAYRHLPLHRVEFRADPVLYKEPIASIHKQFNNVGSL